MKIKAFILTLALLAGIGTAYAQGDTAAVRPAAVSVTLDAGGLRNLDTYLSPLRYGGQHVRVGFERFRAARFRSECRVNQIAAGIGYDHLQNPAGNNTVHTLLADFDWRMMRRWDNVFVDGLRLYAGGGMGFDGGVAYNPRSADLAECRHFGHGCLWREARAIAADAPLASGNAGGRRVFLARLRSDIL